MENRNASKHYKKEELLLLLEITELIAQVKNDSQLLRIIYDKIKPIFNFYDIGLFVLNNDGTKHSDWSATVPELVDSEWNAIAKENSTEILHKNSPAEYVIRVVENMGVTLFDFRELVEQFPNYPQWQVDELNILDLGYIDCLGTNLKIGGEAIGFFCINAQSKNFFKPSQFAFFKAVGDTIAVAVANILANEEIEKLNKELTAQNAYLTDEVQETYNFGDMIGQNEAFQEVCRNISLVAKTDSTVLILGETGTGKELVARAIHNHSSRKNKTLIKLNCAALPANLIESELFGHERGAFTGAIERRIGKFELANGSTLFLDEIGELPLELQSKLLRALQEREIERLGSNKTLTIDVRIIAATNRDLQADIANGKFRSDLYYRLNIFPITLPPLRSRKEDIPLLATHFLQKYTRKIGKNIQGFSTNAVQEMMLYKWYGNIRELEHTIERSVILSNSRLIQGLNLPLGANAKISISPKEFEIKTWDEQERDYLLEVLKITNGKITGKNGAALLLDLKPTTLQSKILKLGIKRQHYVEL